MMDDDDDDDADAAATDDDDDDDDDDGCGVNAALWYDAGWFIPHVSVPLRQHARHQRNSSQSRGVAGTLPGIVCWLLHISACISTLGFVSGLLWLAGRVGRDVI